MIHCQVCNEEISKDLTARGSSYCSMECKARHYKEKYYTSHKVPGISKGTVGAISELRVAADLMQRGYSVFRALSPHSSCDLAILKENRLLRIEVKTAYYARNGSIVKSPVRKNQIFDFLALALPDKIVYEPELS